MPVKKRQEKQKSSKWQYVTKTNEIFGVIFYIIWILIGFFFLLYIIASIRQGVLKSLFRSSPVSEQGEVQTPTETNIPGVGKVDIACVQEALSNESIQKIVIDGNTSKLTDDEKAKLEPCILEKEAKPGQ